MTIVSLFLTATKLAGALVTLTVAANAFSFSRFRNKNLRRFTSPIDESSDTLADFNITGNNLYYDSLIGLQIAINFSYVISLQTCMHA